MKFRAFLAASLLSLSLPTFAQEKRTALTTEDLDRAKALDAGFRKLLESEKPAVRTKLEEARAQIFETAKPWEYKKGFVTIRQLRSPAAVPLLIETLIVRLQSPAVRKGAANAFTVLTGKATPELWLADLDAIATLAKELGDWWEKEKATLSTDLAKMTDAQIEGVVDRLIQLDEELDRVGGGIPDMGAFEEDLSGRMVPGLLERMKIEDRRASAGRLLGRLRKKTGAPELDAIARDPKQEGGLRLGALLALKSAGVELHAAPVIEVLDGAKDQRLRDDALAALAGVCAADRPAAQARLVACLGEKDRATRVAALRALASNAPAGETPLLEKVLFATEDGGEARAALRVLEVIGTPDSREILAKYLKSTLEPSPFHDGIRADAIWAFGTATGKRWAEAGAHPASYYMECARKAVEWWEAGKAK